MRSRCRLILALACGAAIGASGGCAAPARTTALSAGDLDAVVGDMAQRLHREVFADRTPESPPMRIAIQRVENLTSDIIPMDEQWQIMARIRDSQPIVELSNRCNVRFVIPAEYLAESRTREDEPGFAAARAPTHEMTATFMSLLRSAGADRTDLYTCEFRITDLATGNLEWVGVFQFKRAAVGKSYN
jgi:hypothetical protein